MPNRFMKTMRLECDCGKILCTDYYPPAVGKTVLISCHTEKLQVMELKEAVAEVQTVQQIRELFPVSWCQTPEHWFNLKLHHHTVKVGTLSELKAWIESYFSGALVLAAEARNKKPDTDKAQSKEEHSHPRLPIWWKYLKKELISIRDLNRRRDARWNNYDWARERHGSADGNMIRGGKTRFTSCRKAVLREMRNYYDDARQCGAF